METKEVDVEVTREHFDKAIKKRKLECASYNVCTECLYSQALLDVMLNLPTTVMITTNRNSWYIWTSNKSAILHRDAISEEDNRLIVTFDSSETLTLSDDEIQQIFNFPYTFKANIPVDYL